MENYITTNDFFQRTALPNIFHESEIQQKAETFLEAIQAQYGDDEQYKYVMEEIKNEKIKPVEWENPFKSARLAGYLAKMFNWIRDHELQQLREEYDKAQNLVSPCISFC